MDDKKKKDDPVQPKGTAPTTIDPYLPPDDVENTPYTNQGGDLLLVN